MKVVLILVDGMRPDALQNVPQVQQMMREGAYTMQATTVMPSVTLPCHMSLFHSVDPARHGTTTNVYMPQVRPINGLCEVLKSNGKKSAFFYNWEELRDLTRPGSLVFSHFCSGRHEGYAKANNITTDAAIDYITANDVDFAFVYLGYTDEAGHKDGWMSEPYMRSIDNSWQNIERLMTVLGEEYTVIVTADHGGHDRTHGTEMPEDMMIPVFIKGKKVPAGTQLENVSIKDLAPTVTKLLGATADEEWEGHSIL